MGETRQLTFDIYLTPTQRAFAYSDAPIVWLIGGQGEGKTFSGVVSMLLHNRRMNGRAVKAALIRDTFQNLKTMTIPSIEEAIDFMAEQQSDLECAQLFRQAFRWSDGGKKLRGPGIDLDLFGIDDQGSLTKLQGGEYSLVWLEEPAPMFEKANAGLSDDVFTAALSRVARQRKAKPRLQITQNPPEEDHWTWKRAIKEPLNRDPQFPDIYTETFRIPYGENPFLSDLQRQTAKAAFAHDPGLWKRYIEGEAAFVQPGEAVAKEYDEKIHRSTTELIPYPGARGIRFWDGGHNPTCIIAQIHPVTGRLCVYDTLVGENMGMIQLVRGLVKPLVISKYKKVRDWIDLGDPAVRTRDGSNTDMSPAKVITKELNTQFVGGVQNWDTRVQAIKYVLQNQPMLLLCPKEETLHKALRGGWHYKKTNDGKVVKDEAVKNIHSHPADAISQGLPKLITIKRPGGPTKEQREAMERSRRSISAFT